MVHKVHRVYTAYALPHIGYGIADQTEGSVPAILKDLRLAVLSRVDGRVDTQEGQGTVSCLPEVTVIKVLSKGL